MVNDVRQRSETAIMIKPSLHMGEEGAERGSSVSVVRRPVGLKSIDADFSRRVKVPPRVAPERFNVAVVTFGFAAKEDIAPICCRLIETPRRRLGRGYRELIEL